MKKIQDTTEYNVFCHECGQIWTPGQETALWWKAKKHTATGTLSALCVGGEECGCVKKPSKPDAPIRVFGYDLEGREFDIPFAGLTQAAIKFLDLKRSFCDVFIKGVSPTVEKLLYAA